MAYSNVEYVDMMLIYGEARQNAAAASRLYVERFPNRPSPSPPTFIALVIRARETGDLKTHQGRNGGRGRDQMLLNNEEQILNLVDENPSISTRQIARQIGTSTHRLVWRTLRENLHSISKGYMLCNIRIIFCVYSSVDGFCDNMTKFQIFPQSS